MRDSINSMKNILLIIILFSKTLFACECPNLLPITNELAHGYNVIFLGKVDSVSSINTKGNAIAYFTISELYKGNVEQQVQINFDATTACMMSFAKNEEWLMYSTYERFDELKVNICGHSRKLFNTGEQDFYQLAAQRTFEEEKKFLGTTLSIQPFAKAIEMNTQQIDFKPHNDQPSAINKLFLLLLSFVVMVIVYFVTRKKNKQQ